LRYENFEVSFVNAVCNLDLDQPKWRFVWYEPVVQMTILV